MVTRARLRCDLQLQSDGGVDVGAPDDGERRAESIIAEVQAAVTWWPEFAEGAGVDATQMAEIGRHHRLALL